MNIDAMIAKAELISKFKDGEKRYRESALFHKVIDTMLHGVSEIAIIDELINMNDSTMEAFQDYVQRTPPPSIFYQNEK